AMESYVPVAQGDPDGPVLGIALDDLPYVRRQTAKEVGIDLVQVFDQEPFAIGPEGNRLGPGAKLAFAPGPDSPESLQIGPGEQKRPRYGVGIVAGFGPVEPPGGRVQVPGPVRSLTRGSTPGQSLGPEDQHVSHVLAEPGAVGRHEGRGKGTVEPGGVV